MPRRSQKGQRGHRHSVSGGGKMFTDPRREAEYTRDLIKQGYKQGHAKATAKIWVQNKPDRISGAESTVESQERDHERGGGIQPSYSPTPSSNPQDPRTAQAGYDFLTQTMRVWWGDGRVPYDYYNVTPQEWDSFQKAKSPGKWINAVGNAQEYGPVGDTNG